VLHRELCRDVPAHRLADEPHARKAERREQLEIVQHVVVDLGDLLVLRRFTEARMKRNEHLVVARPRCGEVEPRERSGAVKVH
jgi:phage terminase small subunit